MEYDVIVVASGKGERSKLGYNKAFYRMKDGKTVLEHALALFVEDGDCRNIIVVTSEEYMKDVPEEKKLIRIIGGRERKDSVANGLRFAASEYVMIHDAVRPFLKKEALEAVKQKLEEHDAVCLGHMATDTVKKIKDGIIRKTIDRREVFMAETPQAFRRELILEAYEKCPEGSYTDDASIVEAMGHPVAAVINDHRNPKLTIKEDFRGL